MSSAIRKRFLSFVEIETKLATIIPAIAALVYVLYTTETINARSTIIYFIAALFLDMSVTAINNHLDRREDKNQTPHFSNRVSLGIIFVMLSIFVALGGYLAYLHGVTVFLAGLFCLVIGVAYTFGPAPISKSSYGEIFSGFTVGTMIMFIVVSINDPSFQPLGLVLSLSDWRLAMDIDIIGLLSFFLITLPAALPVSNILLANNICDAESDRPFRRTLVHQIGVEKSLRLFAALYIASYIAIVAACITGLLPFWCLLALLTCPIVIKNVRLFFKEQRKDKTFVLSIKNFMVIMLAYIIGITIGAILNLI